ncbi:MAG TPA: ABC transporter substrate-binding protein, partial [Gemmatimonadota bacterium]|nr:ABC transporter substrate-binding protein [Gemmatimonadota bacterium]
LLARPDALDDSARILLRVAAAHMSSSELAGALATAAASRRRIAGRDRAILEAALARELAWAGRQDSASRVAAALSAGARGPERGLADSVRSRTVAPRQGPLVLGAILPTSGRYQVVGSWLREGIELGLEEAAAGGAPRVRLRVVDEGDDPAAVPGLVRQLEREGAVAVLGPVRSRALADAADARTDPGLALVSPTATDAPARGAGAFPLNAYALWDSRRRQADAVRDLGRWLGSRVGVDDAAILFARNPGGRDEALAFRAGLAGAAGSGAVASAAFDPDSTTFRGPIARVGAFGPTAVFVAGGTSATLLQLAPQLSYFGAGGALVAGGPGWAEPGVVRRLEPSPTQERIVATYLDWSDPESGWSRFRASYEKKYGKSLGNNVVPGLGYDAARLLVAALPEDGVPHARAVTRRLAALSGLEGATGTLSPDASSATVARRTLIRVIEDRRLSPADPDSVKAWVRRSGFLEAVSLRRQRAAARQAVRDATPDSTPGGRP